MTFICQYEYQCKVEFRWSHLQIKVFNRQETAKELFAGFVKLLCSFDNI